MNTIEELTIKQDNKCAICMQPFSYKRKRIYDPVKGGILCYSCKEGLKAFNYDAETIKQAINYKNSLNWWDKVVDLKF